MKSRIKTLRPGDLFVLEKRIYQFFHKEEGKDRKDGKIVLHTNIKRMAVSPDLWVTLIHRYTKPIETRLPLLLRRLLTESDSRKCQCGECRIFSKSTHEILDKYKQEIGGKSQNQTGSETQHQESSKQ